MTNRTSTDEMLDSLRQGLREELDPASGRVLREPASVSMAARQRLTREVADWTRKLQSESQYLDRLCADLSRPGLVDTVEQEVRNQVEKVEADYTGACLMYLLRRAEERRPELAAKVFRDLSGLDALPLFVRPKELLHKAAITTNEERFTFVKMAAFEMEPAYSKYLRGLWVLVAIDRDFSVSPPSDFGALVDQLSDRLTAISGLIDCEAAFFRNAAAHHRFNPTDSWKNADLSNLKKGVEEHRSFGVTELMNRLFRLVDVAEIAGAAQRAFMNETCLVSNGFYREMIESIVPLLQLDGPSRERELAALFSQHGSLKAKIAAMQRFTE